MTALCGDEEYYFEGKCLHQARGCSNFDQANNTCTSNGQGEGKLLTIRNPKESHFFAERITNATWLGLTRTTQTTPWKWENGMVFNYTDWHEEEPKDSLNCATLAKNGNRTGWEAQDCQSCQKVVCEKGIFETITIICHNEMENARQLILMFSSFPYRCQLRRSNV